MQLIGPGVFQPGQVELLTSDDGEHYTSCGVVSTTIAPDNPDLAFQTYTFQGEWKARYVRIKAARVQGGFILSGNSCQCSWQFMAVHFPADAIPLENGCRPV